MSTGGRTGGWGVGTVSRGECELKGGLIVVSIVRRRRPVRRLVGYTAGQRLEIGRRLLAEAIRKQELKERDKK